MYVYCWSVCGDDWFNLCTLITQCATGVQPDPAPESTQTGPGEAALTSHHPYTLKQYRYVYFYFCKGIPCLDERETKNRQEIGLKERGRNVA